MSTPKRTRQCEACRRRTTAAIPRWWTGPAEDAPCTGCRKRSRYQAMIESYDGRPRQATAEPIEAPPAHRSPPPQTRPTRPAACDQTNERPPAAPRDTAANKRPPKALMRARLTPGARLMAFVLWSHSRPADREGLRICPLPHGAITTWTGFDRRSAYQHINQLVDAGWVARGKVPKTPKRKAQLVLVLHPRALSMLAAGMRKAEGRMEIDYGRAQPPSKRRILDEPRDDAAWGRAVGRRRARESRLPKGNVMHRE